MIADNLYSSHVDYGQLSPKLARALEWLKANDLTAFQPDQTVEIDAPRIKAGFQAYTTLPPEEAAFEAHRAFIDIQLIVEGRETIYWAPLARLPGIRTPYDYAKDIVYFDEPETSVALRLEAGDFVVLFPTDGHKPKCIATDPSPVRKVVVKVAV